MLKDVFLYEWLNINYHKTIKMGKLFLWDTTLCIRGYYHKRRLHVQYKNK